MSVSVLLGAVLVVGVVTLLVAAAIFHKIRRVHVRLFELETRLREGANQSLMDLFHQIEAGADLRVILDWDKCLPATRGWAASPDFLRIVAERVLRDRPLTIVECGSGVSTLVSARCCQILGQGHVYSLDHQSEYAQGTRDRLRQLGLDDMATVLDAPLKKQMIGGREYSWYALEGLPEAGIDLLVVDGPPAHNDPQARYPAGPLLISRLKQGGAVLVDDADRVGEKEIVRRWMLEFPWLERQQIPVCEKGCVALIAATTR